MARINVLEKHVAELIAAGEVVERPSSVIKELVENAVDAGATAVTVEIIDGGVSMMRVTDNGCGIMRDDIRNAFKRHATSKVCVREDLDAIGTLGFRGEALASICAVARVDLLTKANNEDIGTHYKIEGGDEVLFEDAGCPDGTTFIIRDIFYNVPARMKFLKKNVSEGNAVAAVVEKLALSHSEIAFTLIRDHKQTLVTSGDGNEKNCIYSVLGRDFSNSAVKVDYELDGITVQGFVSKPQAARASRSMQNFFINGRFVKSRTAMAALEEACKGMVMVGKFPACVLHINIPLGLVDVNVHPAKIEVRFVNERPVFEAVYHAVRTALINGDTAKHFKAESMRVEPLVDKSVVKKPYTLSMHEIGQLEKTPVELPSKRAVSAASKQLSQTIKANVEENLDLAKPSRLLTLNDSSSNAAVGTYRESVLSQRSVPARKSVSLDIEMDEELALGKPKEEKQTEPQPSVENEKPEEITKSVDTAFPKDDDRAEEDKTDVSENVHEAEEEIKPLVETDGQPARFIGEAFKTYIIVERGNELVMIDKHALHERIIYEKLRREQGKSYAQYLLEPAAVQLSRAQYGAVLENLDLLDESGFEIDDFGGSTVLIRSAPSFIDAFDAAATIEEMADHILENKKNIESEYTDWLYHNIACRSAVKGGDKSSPQELMELYLKMEESPDYRYCPHGRPTSVVMTRREIEKQFGRIQ